MSLAERAPIVPTSPSVVSPRVAATISVIERRCAEIEEVAVGIYPIDAEVPVAGSPVKRAIEVARCAESPILPVEEYVIEIQIAVLPVRTIKVVGRVDIDEIVEIYLIGGLILVVGEVKLVSHLVCKKQCLLASLLVAHGECGAGHAEQSSQGYNQSFHSGMVLCYCRDVTMQKNEENTA